MVDTNIENYSSEELTDILGLSYPASEKDIIEKTNEYMNKYKKKKNPEMVAFFQDIQDSLLSELSLKEEEKDKTAKNVYNVPVKKDTLNPLLTNVTNRLVNIDSQYRDDTFEVSLSQAARSDTGGTEYSSTYFNANLCEQLTNVLSITVDNVIIPKTWYAIDVYYNNNFFWITNVNKDFLIIIDSGNYTAEDFVIEMNAKLAKAGFLGDDGKKKDICTYNEVNNKLTFVFTDIIDPLGAKMNLSDTGQLLFHETTDTEEGLLKALELYSYFTFYDIGNVKMYKYIYENGVTPDIGNLNFCFLPTGTIDGTLGWIMGFRLPYEFLQISGNEAPVPINLTSSSYFLISLQDYQTNRVNNDIITIMNKQNSQISLPGYITDSLLYKCIKIKSNIATNAGINEKTVDDLLFNFSALSDSNLREYIPSAPRVLTQSQIYTTNEIIKNNKKKSINYKSSAPNTNDVIAIVPINTQGIEAGNLFIQDKIRTNKRVFFGPVNIDRFTVRLLNDKGELVNLNGANWSFTLNVEVLYQL